MLLRKGLLGALAVWMAAPAHLIAQALPGDHPELVSPGTDGIGGSRAQYVLLGPTTSQARTMVDDGHEAAAPADTSQTPATCVPAETSGRYFPHFPGMGVIFSPHLPACQGPAEPKEPELFPFGSCTFEFMA